MSERQFRAVGLGYQMTLPAYRTSFHVDRLRRSSGELAGDLLVRTEWPGARTVEAGDYQGILHYGRMNLTSVTTRRSVGKAIAERVPSPPGEELDWPGLLDEFCIRVMVADREGESEELIGNLPTQIGSGWLLEPIMPEAAHGILFGDGGVGKSILGLALLVSVQTGCEIVPGFTPARTGPTLYLDWEWSKEEADRRTKLICRGAGIAPVEIVYRRGRGRTLADQLESIARLADRIGAEALLIDSATQAIGTSGEGPIEDAANRFKSALDEIGRAALVIDHVPKPRLGERGAQGGAGKPIGSIMKSNWARVSWEMRQSAESDEETTHAALYHRKKNNTWQRRPIGLAMHWTDDHVWWEREDITDDSLLEGLTINERIGRLLAEHPRDVKELARELGKSETHVRKELNKRKDLYVNLGVKGWALVAGGVS